MVILMGCLVLLGWKLDIEFLKSFWLPGGTITANTAAAFILGGLSSLTLHRQLSTQWMRRAGQVCALLVFLIGLLTLIEYGSGLHLGLDSILSRDPAAGTSLLSPYSGEDIGFTLPPSRMSSNIALNFLLLGCSMLLLSESSPLYAIAQILTLVGFSIGWLGVLVYAYGIDTFYGIDSYTKMPLYAAIIFLLLCISILFGRPDRGLMAVFVKDDVGGIVARRWLPASIAIPLVLGWLVVAGYRAWTCSPPIAIAFFGICSTVVCTVAICWNARALGACDRQRKQAEADLQYAKEALQMQVHERTNELSNVILRLYDEIAERQQVEEALRQSEARERERFREIQQALQELQHTQSQLIQSEKMSSLGQLVAGVAHEINNPVNFIYGNLRYARDYTFDLLRLVKLYQKQCPPTREIQEAVEVIELDFMIEDFPKILDSMQVGAERIREIVLSLRTFSRLDEAEMKEINIHEGIESTLMILQSRLKGQADFLGIQVIKEYGTLPPVECYAGQLNQVFMNLLTNAIDALTSDLNEGRSPSYCEIKTVEAKVKSHNSFSGREEEILGKPTILIRTEMRKGQGELANGNSQSAIVNPQFVVITIADNGPGMTEQVRQRLFDPFFTTKPVGRGTGLGLSISYQIVVETHGGQLQCHSAPGQGAEFVISIPIRQYTSQSSRR